MAAAVGFGVLLSPRVQTWAVRRQLARYGAHSRVASVAVGLGATELHGLHWERGGAIFDAPEVRAEFPPIAAALSKRWLVGLLTAKGWTLDLRGVAGAGWGNLLPAGAWAVTPGFRGWLQRLRLPFDLALGATEIEGDILLPGGSGVPPARVHVSISGGGLAAGEQGRFIFRAVALTEADAPVSRLTSDGALSLAMDTPRTFSGAALRLNAAALGRKFPAGVRIVADASAERAPDGEKYAAVLSGETKPLFAVLASLPANGQRPSGNWRLDVADEDVSPFLLGRDLPHFDLQGEGQLDADARGTEVHLAGALHGGFDRLEVLAPRLQPIGGCALLADFDVTRAGPLWRVDRLSVAVQESAPVLAARSLQPFGFDSRTGAFQVADIAGDLFRIDLQGVPARWIAAAFPGADARGGFLTGALVGAARAGALSVRSLGDLALPGCEVRHEGRVLAGPADARFGLQGDYAPTGWQWQATGIRVSRGAAAIAQGNVRVGARRGRQAPIKADSHWQAALPAIVPGAGLRAGVLEAEISAEWAGQASCHATLGATGLVRASGGSLPDLKAEIQADELKDGRVALHAPLTVGSGPAEDAVVLDAIVSGGGGGARWEGTLTTPRLDPENAPVIAALLAGAGDGQLKFFVGSVPWGGIEADSVTGQARFAPDRDAIDALSGRLVGGGTFTMSAALERAADGSERLRAAAVAEDIDAGVLLRRWGGEAGEDPLTGKLRLDARCDGSGATASEVAAGLLGACTVSSKAGHFRLLATAVSPKTAGGNLAIDALRSVASTLGSVIKRRKTTDFTNPAEAAVYVAKALSDIPYDQLSFRLTRESGGDLWCRDFALIAPELRLEGKARVENQSGVAPLDRPLDGTLELRVRGRLADALKYLDALSAAPDDLGYRACPLAITVKGSLHHPDTTELQASLLKLVEGKGADLLNKLLGK